MFGACVVTFNTLREALNKKMREFFKWNGVICILDTFRIILVTDDLFSCVAGLASNDHMIRSLLLSPPLALTAPIPLITRRFP